MMGARKLGRVLPWVAAALVAGSTLSGCAFVNVSLFQEAQPLQEKVIEGKEPGKVLIMDISGLIAYEADDRSGAFREHVGLVARVKEELRKAAEDPELKGLILRVQSPGGTVNASDLLYHELMAFKKEKNIKVVACLLGMATSGGYYVAAAADHIIAQPTTLTGSIGTIAFKLNVQGLLEKVGVESETVKSGDKKDIWSPLRPATKEELSIFQGIISEYQAQFLGVVRAGRPQVTEEDLKVIRDGRVLSGEQALKLHLVDQLGYLSDAVTWAREKAGAPEAQVIIYHRPGTYVENVYSSTRVESWSWMDRIQRQGMSLSGPRVQFMYLWLP
jgi:protease-4